MKHLAWLTLLVATAAMAAAGAAPHHAPAHAAPKPAAPEAPAPKPAAPKADVSRDVVAKGASAAAVTDIPDAAPWGPGADDVLPVSCRLRPECRVDYDCTTTCGRSGGQCLPSGCPVLLCDCN